ncbi:DUF2147 domain-containing protein [Alteriqipengyuania lutimaris]|uniref:DUF2147 domain-containing protein n=1 Tax=Alteriqipengyuania lutimaris TaxID=1538146 RepID=A0A395LQI4_9SPHN|nr:DUF2147 domain-containing protein [Alteriqipengyuania lutimaris]MBB3034129.1 uncharacterized protein (DUF2147 family) [Alteriqipengyuania lutimaris]RDS76940.1 DUF2147 domain-containing protein [Alteriqipengyuania lutimaris]
MKKTLPTMLAGAATIAALAVPALAADPISGRWVTEDKDAVITIGNCGSSLCGKISKFLETPPDGANQRDVNNPKKSLRSRKLMGLPVLTNLRQDGDVFRGDIYDPKSGKTYESIVERTSTNRLSVKGCARVIVKVCQEQTWTRP